MFTIGVMTGTSMDGIDACLADLSSPRPRRVASLHSPLSAGLQSRLQRIQMSHWDTDPLLQVAQASRELMLAIAPVVRSLMQESPEPVRAVGVHGQTVRHWPEQGLSLQLAAPAVLAEALGIDVVSDFRSRDLAAGGQGAPLVPPFHAAILAGQHQGPVAVLNLGGIANLTLLDGAEVLGFDTGPANTLMDLWCQAHLGQPYDAGGQWAASALPDPTLVGQMKSDPFFARRGPKSTGRDYFSMDWLQAQLRASGAAHPPVVVQASLLALTVETVSDALPRSLEALYLCGGGSRNEALRLALSRLLPAACALRTTEAMGWPEQDIEAGAFAWLAGQHLLGRPANRPAVTGSAGLRVLGSLTPGLRR